VTLLSVFLLEVMDKMPTAQTLWIPGLVVGAIGALAGWRYRIIAWLAVGAACILIWTSLVTYTDSAVGPAVWRESGWPYLLHHFGRGAVALVPPLLALRHRAAAA
jgi:hypothetical protein